MSNKNLPKQQNSQNQKAQTKTQPVQQSGKPQNQKAAGQCQPQNKKSGQGCCS